MGLKTQKLTHYGETVTITFQAKNPGTFEHNGWTEFDGRTRHTHMVGRIVVMTIPCEIFPEAALVNSHVDYHGSHKNIARRMLVN